jgi:hypothetical protein
VAYDGIGGSFGVTPISPLGFLLEANHPFGGEICSISQSGRGFRVGSSIFELVEVDEHDEVDRALEARNAAGPAALEALVSDPSGMSECHSGVSSMRRRRSSSATPVHNRREEVDGSFEVKDDVVGVA